MIKLGYGTIPKTINVDNKTIEKNASGELQIKNIKPVFKIYSINGGNTSNETTFTEVASITIPANTFDIVDLYIMVDTSAYSVEAEAANLDYQILVNGNIKRSMQNEVYRGGSQSFCYSENSFDNSSDLQIQVKAKTSRSTTRAECDILQVIAIKD